jgi:hypothetical protein
MESNVPPNNTPQQFRLVEIEIITQQVNSSDKEEFMRCILNASLVCVSWGFIEQGFS